MNLLGKAAALGFVTVALLVGVGCSAAPEEGSGDDDVVTGASTPSQVTNIFEQVKTCDNLFKDRAAFREADLQEGVLRWKCGDVDGVSISKCESDLALLAAEETKRKQDVTEGRRNALNACGDGYGQEYCEYNAVAKGNIVNAVKQSTALKDADVVQCVFTSVHSDFKGDDAEAYGNSLASQVKGQLVAAERVPEGRVTAMKQGVNSRGAADALIFDCANLARTGVKWAKDADRQVLCYNAWSKAATPAEKAKLQTACSNKDLSDDAAWAKVGIPQTALTEADKDLAACSMVARPKTITVDGKQEETIIGVSWRNSDPTICARAYRAASECKVNFKEIGEVAANLPGFSMQGWTNRETLPTGCKYVNVDNKPYAHVVVCTANAQDVKNYRTQKKPLQTLCRDKFGVNVAMQAPIGALANLSGAKEETPFCKAFIAGARKSQGGSPAPAKQ